MVILVIRMVKAESSLPATATKNVKLEFRWCGLGTAPLI